MTQIIHRFRTLAAIALATTALATASAETRTNVVPTYSVTPSNYGSLDEIPAGTITVDFPEFSDVWCSVSYIYMTADNGLRGKYKIDAKGRKLLIEIPYALQRTGTYSFHMPADSFTGYIGCNDGDDFDAFDIVYVVENEDYDTPGPNVLPDGLQAQDWVLSFDDDARRVKVAIQGKKFYLGNLSNELPDSYVIGEIDGDSVTFPLTRMGYSQQLESEVYFVPGVWDYRYVPEIDDMWMDYFIDPVFTFAYDAVGRELTATKAYSAIFIGNSDLVGNLAPAWTEYFYEPNIKWYTEQSQYEPICDPEFIYAYPDMETGADCIEFYLPSINSVGYPLDTNDMYYEFYVDGQVFTFNPRFYMGISKVMTQIPFNFCDDNNDIFAMGSNHFINLYNQRYKTVGLKLYYNSPDGTLYESEYVEADISELSEGQISGVGMARTLGEPTTTEYYSLSGIRVDKPSNGLYIKVETMADGSRCTSRVMLREAR